MFRLGGKRHWFVSVRRDYAYVWQRGRFDADIKFWQDGLSNPKAVQPVDKETCLRFSLSSEKDFGFFREAVMGKLQSIEWAGATAPVVPDQEKCQHFIQELQTRQGEAQARMGQAILDFLKSKSVRFTWHHTKHRESVVARLVSRREKQWLVGMATDGRIWIPFGQMKKQPPFNDRSKRENWQAS